MVADTVRRDHVSCYGYARRTTPFLESLAERAVVFDRAYSTSCWTLPAHASIFTGLYPSGHRATWENYRLDEDLVTLAHVLQRAGYYTAGLTTNEVIAPDKGFGRGFDDYTLVKHKPGWEEHAGLKTLRSTLERTSDKPFFYFCNLMEAHDPYDSSEQFFGSFLSNPEYRNDVSISVFQTLADPARHVFEPRLTHLGEHYDAELRYVDYVVGQMARLLQTSGKWNETLFIVTSDHGEHLGEHDLLEHQFSLYEELIRVPLLMHYPGVFDGGTRDDRMVQLTDLFPTILDVAGINDGPPGVQGISMLSSEGFDETRPVLCEFALHPIFSDSDLVPVTDRYLELPNVQRYNRRLTSLRVGPLKLIRGDDDFEALYNVEVDPGEQQDLSTQDRFQDDLARLKRLLKKTVDAVKRGQHPDPAELSEEDVERLKGLGYLR